MEHRRGKLIARVAVTFLCLGALATVAAAAPGKGTLYGTDAFFGNLITIDTETGAGTIVAPITGIQGTTPSLAVDPRNGTMYLGGGGGDPNVYTVDRTTAVATLVGDSGLGVAAIGALDFRQNGELFAAVNIAGDGGTGSDHLARINKATGVATVIGSFGACTGVTVPSDGGGSSSIEGIEAIAFDKGGALWGALSARGAAGTPGLYKINRNTGAATFVAPIVHKTTGLPASGGVVSLQFDCEGDLFGGTATAQGQATDGGKLLEMNKRGKFKFMPAAATGGSSLGALAFGSACG